MDRGQIHNILQLCCSGGLIAAVFTAPYFLGGTPPLAEAGLTAVIFILSAVWFFKKLVIDRDFSFHLPLWPLAFLFVGLLLWQLLPLPPSLLQKISPQSYHLKVALPASLGLINEGWVSISLRPDLGWNGLALVLSYLLVFWIFSNKLTGKDFSRVVSWSIVFAALALSCLAIFQKISGARGIYWSYPTVSPFYGPFINPNHGGAYLGMLIPFLFFFSLGGPSRGRRLLAAIALAFTTLALLYSLSRGAISAFLISGAVLLLYTWKTHRDLGASHRHRLYPAMMALLLTATLLIWLGWGGLPEKMQTLYNLDLPNDYRWQVWHDSWRLVRAFPLFGSGWATFQAAYPSVQTVETARQVAFAENDWVQLASETGLAGGLVLFLFLIALGRRLKQTFTSHHPRRKAIGAGFALLFLALHCLTNFNLSVPAIGLLGAVMLAYLFRGTA